MNHRFMGPAFLQGKAGPLRLWRWGEIGEGRRKEVNAFCGRGGALNFGRRAPFSPLVSPP